MTSTVSESHKRCCLIFAHAPHLRNDARVNVYLTYHIQGGYYAYMENVQRLGYGQVISIIEEIQNTLDVMKP